MAAKAAQKNKKQTKKRGTKRFVKRFFAVGALIFMMIFCVLAFKFIPEVNKAAEWLDEHPEIADEINTRPSKIFSADGKVLYSVSSEYRNYLPYEKIPKLVRNAFIAAEDKRFFDHSGVDYIGLARGIVVNLKSGRLAQGGSTIPMQLAKRLYSSNAQTFQRKLADIAFAIQLERRYSKEKILEMYMNQIYFGSGAYGVEAAGEIYFNKDVDKLNVSEAATLARCVRRPSDQNPFANYKRALENRDYVLRTMFGEAMIDEKTYKASLKDQPKLNKYRPSTTARLNAAPYFVQHVLDVVKRDFPEINLKEGGYRIETTLDYGLQKIAEEEAREVVRDNRSVTTAALVLINSEGKILAEVGGVDFKRNNYNVVTQGRRQPGSSFKPIVYAAALASGAISPYDSISNERTKYVDASGNVYEPDNHGGKSGGSVSITSAIAYSMNIPAVHVIDKVGPQTVVNYAYDNFGFKSHLYPYLSLALGTSEVSPIEMAEAYSVFMLHGDRVRPYPVTKILDPNGNVLKFYEPEINRGVFDEKTTELIDGYLRSVVTKRGGTGGRASVVPGARGKTGTTQDNKDAWFCGYARGLLAIGWVANEHRTGKKWTYSPMPHVYGGTVTINLWRAVMKPAEKKYGRKDEEESHHEQKEEPKKEPVLVTPEPKKEEVPPNAVPATTPSTEEPPPDNEIRDDDGSPADPSELIPAEPEPQPKPEPPKPAPPKPVQPPKPSVVRREPPPVEYVTVEICSDTHEIATIYCPETTRKRYRKGEQPRKRCSLHHGL